MGDHRQKGSLKRWDVFDIRRFNGKANDFLKPTANSRVSESEEPDDGDDEQSDNDGDLFNGDDADEQPPFSLNSSTAFDFLQPLQQTADRVGRQVEEFARVLDRFNADREPSDQALWNDARGVLAEFSKLTSKRLKKTAARNGRSSSSSRTRRSLGDYEAETQKLQYEANLWALASDVLICDSPDQIADSRASHETVLNELHRYSQPAEVWNAFLDADATAQQYEVILGWLQDTAEIDSPKIEEVLANLNAKAERGDGIWSAGHLYTKNAIKAQKRTRSWPKPLNTAKLSITTSHIRSLDSEPLVTNMDPDVQARQGHVLIPQDDFHEQYAWRACWEFLRRGTKQQDVRTWWAERKEIWRSVCLKSKSIHPDQQSPALAHITNIASNRNWHELCNQICQDSENLYTFQAAVYGVLAGNLEVTSKVCQTIDDGLFAHFNSLLIERYKVFLSVWDAKIRDANKSVYTPGPPKWEQIRQYLTSCQVDEMTREESLQSHKAIQAAIVSQDFEAFFVRTGQAAAKVAHLTEDNAHLMEKDDKPPADEYAQITASDFDSVRVVVHLQLILRTLGYLNEVYDKHLYTVENNIASYIGWLQRERKFELIPLYASRLSEDRIPHVLGAILSDIDDPKDRELQIKLIKQYKIGVPKVLWGNFCLANAALIAEVQNQGIRNRLPKITEYVGAGRIKNVKVKPHFVGSDIREEDRVAISSVEWFRYTDAQNWGQACWAIATLYMTFLTEGRLAAANALAEAANLSDMSLAALNMNLNIAEASDDEDVDMNVVNGEESHKPISQSRKRKQPAANLLLRPGISREQLASKSLVWVQLEQLIIVLNAFDSWSVAEAQMEENRNNPTQMRALKRDLKQILEAIQELMYPLLEKDWLCRPNDEIEGAVLDDIRNHYLTECILAYDSVLYYAGHALSRSYLVECMNLAQVVANNPTLTNAFVESKRMRELVTAFALDSKALLHANEVDHGKKTKKDSCINIWQIKGLSLNEPTNLEALD